MRAFKESLGVGLKTAFTRTLEISVNVSDYRVGAVLGFRDLAKSELEESGAVFADGGRRRGEKTFLNERLRLEEFAALI